MQRLLAILTVIAYLLSGSGVIDALHREAHGHAHAIAATGFASHDHRGGCHSHHHAHDEGSGSGQAEGDASDCPICVALALAGTGSTPPPIAAFTIARVSHRIAVVDAFAPAPSPLGALKARPPPAA
ncbi:MAG: DUF2946 family protein [Phycisphaerae bacterium]|nr:DUF2946 family protein [Phycisphaerae bacterium]